MLKQRQLQYKDGTPVDYSRVVAAARTFENDPSLVGQTVAIQKSPFDRPNRKGVYTATDVLWKGHRAIEGKFANRDYALLIGCMDKDFAFKAWQHVKAQIGRRIQLATIFVAGGAAQENSHRLADLAAIMTYYGGFRPLHSIWLAGHLENCGGLAAFSCNGSAVCAHYGFAPNSVQELTFVKRIMEAAQPTLVGGYEGQVHSFVVKNRNRPQVVELS